LPTNIETAPKRDRVTTTVDGIAFDAVTEDEVIAHVLSELEAGRGGYMVTPNVDILRQLRRSQNRHLADRADLVLADGMPVVWASRLLRRPLPARVPGSSLVFSLARAAAAQERRVFLLGGAENAAERAAQRLEGDGVLVAGWHFPPFGFESDAVAGRAIVDALAGSAPDIVYVGLGFPKQERLILELRDRFPATWFIGCGGSLAFASGDVSRAPVALQNAGLEWVHRLAKDPRRLVRRYLVDDVPYTVGLLLRAAFGALRSGAGSEQAAANASRDSDLLGIGTGRVITLPVASGTAAGRNSRGDSDGGVDSDGWHESRVSAK
jgi:N-acetylglucosaminyldiphosphoundecaprenol N-acetyl-beta-D-mannosaminyltransferase